MRDKSTIWFVFTNPVGFSGQYEATRLILDGIAREKWDIRSIAFPPLLRSASKVRAYIKYAVSVAAAWAKAWRIFGEEGNRIVYLNLGQSVTGMLIAMVPLLVARFTPARTIISLHGNRFTEWSKADPRLLLFRAVLSNANIITVLGERQLGTLRAIGIRCEIEVVENSCELEQIPPEEMVHKHKDERTLRVLYLGSLIDTKGYPMLIEALELLSVAEGGSIEVVVCGRFVESPYNRMFKTALECEEWLMKKCATINSSGRVKLSWVPGARGGAKMELFRRAHVFVFPTYYPVEAQPIVLIEAMASGCAICVSPAGEIPRMFDEESCLWINARDKVDICSAITRLALDPAERLRLAQRALTQYQRRYSGSAYSRRWEQILNRQLSVARKFSRREQWEI